MHPCIVKKATEVENDCIALAFDGFRKNDWTRGPVTVRLLDLGIPEACVYTLALERRGACAVQTCRPRNACSDPYLRALCFYVCVKTDRAESRVFPRTYNDIGAESRSRPSPCSHGLIQSFSIAVTSFPRHGALSLSHSNRPLITGSFLPGHSSAASTDFCKRISFAQ